MFGISSNQLSSRFSSVILNSYEQAFITKEALLNAQNFVAWAIAHVGGMMYCLHHSYNPERLNQLSPEEVKSLSSQKIYWLTPKQRQVLNTAVLSPDQQMIFFLNESSCKRILEVIKDIPQRRRSISYLSALKEFPRIPEEEKDEKFFRFLHELANDTSVNQNIKNHIIDECMSFYGFISEIFWIVILAMRRKFLFWNI